MLDRGEVLTLEQIHERVNKMSPFKLELDTVAKDLAGLVRDGFVTELVGEDKKRHYMLSIDVPNKSSKDWN